MNNLEYLEYLNKHVYGHLEAKKAVITLARRAINKAYYRHTQHKEIDLGGMRLLLIGKSGTGKTLLVDKLLEGANVPKVYIDASKLNPKGHRDDYSTSEIPNLIAKKAEEYAKINNISFDYALELTIVYIDEIDKLCCSFESTGNWNKTIQQGLLTLLDGGLETSKVNYIFSGAFSELFGQKSTVKHSVGFFGSEIKSETKEITDKDLIDFGLIPELTGRITNIVQLDEFTKQDMIRIYDKIYKEKINALRQLGVLLPMGLSADIDKEGIIDRALESEQGVRYIHRELEKILSDFEFNTPEI